VYQDTHDHGELAYHLKLSNLSNWDDRLCVTRWAYDRSTKLAFCNIVPTYFSIQEKPFPVKATTTSATLCIFCQLCYGWWAKKSLMSTTWFLSWISKVSMEFNCEAIRYTSTWRKFAPVEGLSHDLVCTGSIYHVHFAWQVWHGQLSPRFEFNKLKSFSGVEINQNHVNKRILGEKGFAVV